MVTVGMKLKDACSLEESYDKPRQCIKKQRYHFADKDPYCPWFFSSYVQMWVEPQRNLRAKEFMLLKCGAGENSWESFGQQGDQTNQS